MINMNKTDRAKALIELYRSLNPSVVNEWNIAREITNDLQEYLSTSERSKEEKVKRYQSNELYNESY